MNDGGFLSSGGSDDDGERSWLLTPSEGQALAGPCGVWREEERGEIKG